MIHQIAEPGFTTPDEVNLSQPDVVLSIHVKFMRAGARLIETNTFGANRIKLSTIGRADDVLAINHKGVKLAREAREIANEDVFIGGALGPTGLRIERSAFQARLLRDVFIEQAAALEERGVDCFVLETFQSGWEIQQACRAVREVSALPIVAQITLPAREDWSEPDPSEPVDGRTAALIDQLCALEADVIGLNCSLGPGQMIPPFRQLARQTTGRRLSFQPNSGLPRMEGGRYLYPSAAPDYFAMCAREAVGLGARLVGGCCGTTPAQVAAIAAAIKTPVAARPVVRLQHRARPVVDADAPRVQSELAQRLEKGEFVVSMQVDPPKGTAVKMIVDACEDFRASGHVHAVDVNSNPMARLHMDALWMSALIQREGVETIAHYTPRDASLMGIEGNLLGAWNFGVRNVLVITGDPSMVNGEPGGNDVYQTDSIGLVQQIANLNAGRDCFGNPIGSPPNFNIGVAVNPNHEDLDHEVARFRAKIEAGAQFAMTQVFFEWDCWERFMDKLGGSSPIPILVAVWPLTSYRLARRIHNEVPGIFLPEELLRRLKEAGPEGRAVGFDHARYMLAESRKRAQGAYVIAPFKRPRAALELFDPA